MNIYDYQRAGANIPAVSGYAGAKRAVPQTLMRQPTAEMGEFSAREAIDAMNRLSNIEQAQHELNMEKQMLGTMGKENIKGSILTAGGIGLKGLQAWETGKEQEKQDIRAKLRLDAQDAIMKSVQKYPDLYAQAYLANLKSIYMKPIPKTFRQELLSPIPSKYTQPQLGQFGGGMQ